FSRCPRYPETAQDIDFTTLEFYMDDEGNIIVNGYLTFRNDFFRPSPRFNTMELLERGQWQRTLFSQDLVDLCATLEDPNNNIYKLASNMKQRRCPYRKGHVEYFVNVTIDIFSTLSLEFIGEWRIQSMNGKGSCTMIQYSILDI
ncbi:hypothetical protein RP20_CCG014418, partial [Aedes albopictus]